VHGRIAQVPRQAAFGHDPGPARMSFGRRDRPAEGMLNGRCVRRGLVAGDQVRGLTTQPPLHLGGERLGVLDGPRPGDDRQDQPVLGVVGNMVPVAPLVVVGRISGVAVALLLGDEGPLLVELDLPGPRGKKPRARQERRGHAGRPGGPAG